MTNVGVLGAHGRMGTAICAAVEAADDLVLVERIGRDDSLQALVDANADVVIDVSNAEAGRTNLPWLAEHGFDAVVGATGFSDDELQAFGESFARAGKRLFLVPNFSIGAVLLMHFAELAAPYFEGVEIVELHHNRKLDAPSGTAALTARRIASARNQPWANDATKRVDAPGARGGNIDGVQVHSVRLPGFLAHEEVLFGAEAQTLTLRHDSYDRAAFMPGVLTAVRSVDSLPHGLTVGLDAVLNLS